MQGDIDTVKFHGKWVNRVEGRYSTYAEALAVNKIIDEKTNTFFETVKVRGKYVNQAVQKYDLQKNAAEFGMAIARKLKVEWFQKGLFGRIRERNTYGHDPRNILG